MSEPVERSTIPRRETVDLGVLPRPELSIVGPVYNEEDGIAEFHRRLQAVRAELPMTSEVVYVDDGSADSSLELLMKFHQDDPSVRVLSFSRNFGHQIAISAGIEHARGQAVVCMDTDLQDQPEVIPELVERWQDGAQLVAAVRRNRAGEPRWRLAASRTFYRVVRRLTNLDIKFDAGDFRLMDRRVVDVLNAMPERDRFVRGMTAWVGFRQDAVEYDRDARFAGESKYPFSKSLRLAMAAVTSFSFVPLQIAGAFGLVLALLCLIALPVIVIARLLGVEGLGGQTTVLVALLFFSGVQMFFMGVFGEYLGRVYQELKSRPLFVIESDTGPPPPADHAWRATAAPPWARLGLERAGVACIVCGWAGEAFEGPVHCEGNRCPQCGSIGRDRFLIHSLCSRVEQRDGLRLLETSPRMGDDYREAMARWFDYTASDFDERAHRAAVKVDLQDIDLPDGSLDVVCTAHVLEHVPDTDRALAELRRVLAPGGWLLLQVPVLQAATAPPDEPEFHGDDTPVFWRFGHDLTARLRDHGFAVELLCTEELRDLVAAGATRWPGPGSPEFDADAVVAGAVLDDLVPVADRDTARRNGFEPAYMYLTWACRRSA